MKVSLFIPCTVDMMMPEIGVATHVLLTGLDVQTIYHKEQTCCGQPLFNAGYRDQARKAAKHFIDVLGKMNVSSARPALAYAWSNITILNC